MNFICSLLYDAVLNNNRVHYIFKPLITIILFILVPVLFAPGFVFLKFLNILTKAYGTLLIKRLKLKLSRD